MFFTKALLARNPKPDNFWKRRRLFKLTAHYYGRRRNCYSIAIKYCHRALVYATKARKLKKVDMKELWTQRVEAGARELGSTAEALAAGLARCSISLSMKSLSNLAIWEPRTFKALTQVASAKLRQDPPKGLADLGPPPKGVITRGML
nr:EOG090X0H9C [Eulimnadia texana]